MRSIRIGVPSGNLKLVLFEGTEDEIVKPIKAIKTKPYVENCGVKYFLTKEEIKEMNNLKETFR